MHVTDALLHLQSPYFSCAYFTLASNLRLQRKAAHLQLLDPCPEGGSFISCADDKEINSLGMLLDLSQESPASGQSRCMRPCSSAGLGNT